MKVMQPNPDEQPNSVPFDVVVSVCVFTYNHGPYIRQALNSVLMQQTKFPFEILVGEDDSKDETRDICREFAKRYPDKIRLFLGHEKNKIYINGAKTGNYNSRQLRIACRGKYVAYLEGDDFWIDEQKLQRQWEFMERHPQIELSGTRCLRWTPKNADGAKIVPLPKYGHFVSYQDLGLFKIYVHTSTFFAKSESVFKYADWVDNVVQGDLATLISLGASAGGVPVLPDITSVYRYNNKGIWSGATNEQRAMQHSHFMRAYIASSISQIEPRIAARYRRLLSYGETRAKSRTTALRSLRFRVFALFYYPEIILYNIINRFKESQ